MQILRAEHCLTQEGWRSPAYLSLDDSGFITAIGAEGQETARLDGVVIPGIANVHSHAFQRAMVGATEQGAPNRDDFWSWRTRMYHLALTVTPDDLSAIAEMAYVEMLEAGMTAVGEFHYLHHAPDGTPYDDPAEMSYVMLRAAESTGIAITHLPVLYRWGGFGKPPVDNQRRFVSRTIEDWYAIVDNAKKASRSNPLASVGLAPHSVRAVDYDDMLGVMQWTVEPANRSERTVIHIHVAEQEKEVKEALAHLKMRPAAWLLENFAGENFCFVHATHVDERELREMAKRRIVVGLCPSTEANLGDGIFPAHEYLAVGGRFAIGSDSQVTIDPAEELRLLEYGQRLVHRRRNLLGGGRSLLQRAALGGAEILAQPAGAIAIGKRADLVVLDPAHPRLVGRSPDETIDAWVFGSVANGVREVWVGGKRVVAGQHPRRAEIVDRYASTLRRLGGWSPTVTQLPLLQPRQ